jgi:small subunit ribosomal protein S2
MRAIHLYCDLFAGAVLDGLQAELAASGVDIGARAVLAAETVAADDEVEPTMAEAAPEPTMDEAAEIEPAIDGAAEAVANEIEDEAPAARA